MAPLMERSTGTMAARDGPTSAAVPTRLARNRPRHFTGKIRRIVCAYMNRGTLGDDPSHRINEINDLTIYNGKLYAGLLPKGQVFRLWQGDQWTLIKQLVDNDAYDPRLVETWNRAPSMAVYRGRLFVGTSNCHGSFDTCPHPQAGRNVSYDDDLGGGWHHLVAVMDQTELRLYVDGKLASRSASFAPGVFNLSNGKSLDLGVGPQNHFSGSLSDVRIYDRALDEGNVAALR